MRSISARSTLLSNQTSIVAKSHLRAKSTSPTNSGSGAVKCSGLGKKLQAYQIGMKRALKAIKKPERTGHRSNSLLSPGI